MAVVDIMACRPRPKACRRLDFGDDPPSQSNNNNTGDELERHLVEKSAEYNFDFKEERPLNGPDARYHWELVGGREGENGDCRAEDRPGRAETPKRDDAVNAEQRDCTAGSRPAAVDVTALSPLRTAAGCPCRTDAEEKEAQDPVRRWPLIAEEEKLRQIDVRVDQVDGRRTATSSAPCLKRQSSITDYYRETKQARYQQQADSKINSESNNTSPAP
jgi:hypothetical protein